jgi:signal peptidase I
MRTRLALPKQLTTALLFGALFGAWLLFAPMQLGGQAAFVIINGNSMEPLYRRDDLVIIRAEPSYGVGDIVTYRHPEIGPVIHRIIGRNGDRWVFQGDHNDFIDPYEPLTSELMGRSWIHIPSVGKVLTLVRQSPLLMALALGGGVIVMTLSSQSKDGKARRGKRGRPAGQAPQGGGSEWALTLFGVLAMASLALTAFAFTQPLSREVSDSLSYSQQGSFRYSADAPPGLYDADNIQPGEPVFRQLSRVLSVDFDYQFASDTPAELNGSHSLTAILSAQNGWKRTIALVEPQPFSGAQLSAHGTIELSLLNTMIDEFQAQTGLERQQYTLTLLPQVSIEGALGGEPLHDSFAPLLEFRLDEVQLQMVPDGDGKDVLRPVQEGTLSRARSEPNAISPLGIKLDVAMARKAGLIAAGVFLILTALAGLWLLRALGQGEQARIQMRYGALIVDMAGQPDLREARAVRVGSIDDLAKLAERHGALILRDGSAAPTRYIVHNDGATYIYGGGEAAAEAPPAVEAPPPADLPAAPEASEPPWQERFLQSLRETGLAAEACHNIGIDMVTAYRERERSAEFAQAWKDARLVAWQQHTLKGQSQ